MYIYVNQRFTAAATESEIAAELLHFFEDYGQLGQNGIISVTTEVKKHPGQQFNIIVLGGYGQHLNA